MLKSLNTQLKIQLMEKIKIDDIFIEHSSNSYLFWQVIDKVRNKIVINEIYSKLIIIGGIEYYKPIKDDFATDRIIEQEIQFVVGNLIYLEDSTETNLFHNWDGSLFNLKSSIKKPSNLFSI